MGKIKVTSNTVYDKELLERVKLIPAIYRYPRKKEKK